MEEKLKDYRVKVTELYSGYIWVKAKSREEAIEIAPAYCECEFELLYDCEIIEEDEP